MKCLPPSPAAVIPIGLSWDWSPPVGGAMPEPVLLAVSLERKHHGYVGAVEGDQRAVQGQRTGARSHVHPFCAMHASRTIHSSAEAFINTKNSGTAVRLAPQTQSLPVRTPAILPYSSRPATLSQAPPASPPQRCPGSLFFLDAFQTKRPPAPISRHLEVVGVARHLLQCEDLPADQIVRPRHTRSGYRALESSTRHALSPRSDQPYSRRPVSRHPLLPPRQVGNNCLRMPSYGQRHDLSPPEQVAPSCAQRTVEPHRGAPRTAISGHPYCPGILLHPFHQPTPGRIPPRADLTNTQRQDASPSS